MLESEDAESRCAVSHHTRGEKKIGDACGREKSNILTWGGVAGSKGSRKPVDRTPRTKSEGDPRDRTLKIVDHIAGVSF